MEIAIAIIKNLLVVGVSLYIINAIIQLWSFGLPNKKIATKLLDELYIKKQYHCGNNIICSHDTELNYIAKPFMPHLWKYYIDYGQREKKKLLVWRWSKNAKTIKLLFETAPLTKDFIGKDIQNKLGDFLSRLGEPD